MNWLISRRFLRRVVSITLFFCLTLLIVAASPLWVPLSFIAGLVFESARSSLRCMCFLTAYLVCESVGILLGFWLWLRYRGATFLEKNRQLQGWWAETLRASAENLFRLNFVVEGHDALNGPGAIVLPRHSSIGDTILPVSFYALPRGLGVRYVLKRELLLDPCLDIVGNRLPNVFLNRAADDMSGELDLLTRLAKNASEQEAVVIYMEGTRFSSVKRAAILRSLKQRLSEADYLQANQWEALLPPRLAGALALIEAAPHKDLLFCAHTGFEGSASFRSLFNGGWMDTTIRIRFWRIPARAIPQDAEGRRTLLLSEWQKMHENVVEMYGA